MNDKERLKDAFSQLERYGEVSHPLILDILEELVEINENVAHGSSHRLIKTNMTKIKLLTDELLLEL